MKYKKYNFNEKLVNKYAFNNQIDREIVKFLLRRERIEELPFLNRDIPLYMEYLYIKNLNSAAKFIKEIIENELKTLVIYDNDLDGYGAYKIIENIFNSNGYLLNINYKVFWSNIPIFTPENAQKLVKEGYERIIFLDMGQSSTEGLEILSENNIGALVIDHHSQVFQEVENVIYLVPHIDLNFTISTGGLAFFLERQIKRIENKKFAQQYIIFDLETTGLKIDQDDITEIAAYKIEGGDIISFFHSYLKTNKKIPKKVAEITGITNEFLLEKGKDPEIIINLFKKFIGDTPLVAHNVSFDSSFINKYLKKYNLPPLNNKLYDTVILSKTFFKGLKSYSLSSIVEHLNLFKGPYHHATDDAKALYRLFLEILLKICNLRKNPNDYTLFIYYLTNFSDRMRLDKLNHLFLNKIDKKLVFHNMIRDNSYTKLLINSYYVVGKLIPILNSHLRNDNLKKIDDFFIKKKIELSYEKGKSSLATIQDKNIGKNLNPYGKIVFMLIDKQFEEKRGMIASMISKTNNMPAVVLVKGNPFVGSSRYINGEILSFFEANSNLFLSYGGHNKAVGFSIEQQNIPEFIEKMDMWFSKHEENEEILYYDEILGLEKINNKILTLVKNLGPYSKEFPPPIYLDKNNITINDIHRFGAKGASIFYEFKKFNNTFYGISLYSWEKYKKIGKNHKVSILYTPMLEKYNQNYVLYLHRIESI